MITKYNTIEFKEKRNWQCQNRINYLLDQLPPYCKDFDIWAKQSYVIKTRMEYLQDIYTFFCFLIIRKQNIESVKNIQLTDLEKLNGFDFDRYSEWLTDYKIDVNDEAEISKHNSMVTKKRKISALRTFFHFLYIRELIYCNPCEKAIMPNIKKKKNKDIVVLSDKERKLFLEHIDYCLTKAQQQATTDNNVPPNKKIQLRPFLILRDKAIIYLLLGTGLRVAELCAINCEDISFEMGYINVIRKEDSDEDSTTDKVYLHPDVSAILTKYIYHARSHIGANADNYDALFISSMHARMTPRAVELMVKSYAEAVLGKKCGITPHKLRASFGTRYYQETGDIFATSSAMNHSSVDVTASNYINDGEIAKKRVAEIPIK